MSPKATEKWVLLKSMHLGFLRDSFPRGCVIEFDPATKTLTMDGRTFENSDKIDTVKDLAILKAHTENHPEDPWVAPYTAEAVAAAKSDSVPVQRPSPKKEQQQSMQVVQSDEDLMDVDIDISHTQVGKIKAAQREAAHQKVEEEGMPIIRGDETPEERVSRLQSTVPKMKVVQDDSLGDIVGPSLNQGKTPKGRSKEEIAQIRRENLAKARKAKAAKRKARKAKKVGVQRNPVRSPEQAQEVLGK